MADRIADQIDEDLDDRPLLAIGRQRLVRLELDTDAARFGRRRDQHHRLDGQRRQVDGAVALPRLLAHRMDDRQQMAGRGRNIAGISRIVAAQRAVGTIGDALGGYR